MSIAKNVLMIGGGIYFGKMLFSWLGSAAYNNINYTIGTPRINWQASGNGSIAIDLPIQVQNGNAIGITVVEVTGKVFYGTAQIATINVPMPTRIAPQAAATLNLRLSINSAQLFNDITNSIQTQGVMNTIIQRLRFVGVVKTDLINIPLDTFIPIA